mgnify:CR=1 FL=1
MFQLKNEEKKVEYLELIYDLVFVYMVGRNNALLSHFENGFVSGAAVDQHGCRPCKNQNDRNNKEYFSCNSCDLKKQCNQNIDIHSHCMNHKLNTIFKKEIILMWILTAMVTVIFYFILGNIYSIYLNTSKECDLFFGADSPRVLTDLTIWPPQISK